MLITHYDAIALADDYAHFMSILLDFRVCCAEKKIRRKTIYVRSYNKLKRFYDGIFPKNDRPIWMEDEIDPFFKKIEKILKVSRINEGYIDEIGSLLHSLQMRMDENSFKLLDLLIAVDIKHSYPEKLHQATYILMKNDEYESAVLAAFKYLDSHLKSLLGAKSSEYYGEELINFAFSPKSGVLQLQGHLNEQNGVRNFFSGANAIFRNPSAHRFVDYDDASAETIIAMVAMMANLASKIKETSKQKHK